MSRIILFAVAQALLLVFFTCCGRVSSDRIRKEVFGNHQGRDIYILTLTNSHGNVLKVINYGARITWIEVPDRMGKKANVTFGYDTFEETLAGDKYFGSVIGRYANRISNGRFILDDVVYNLPQNDGPNTLHGGPEGWHSVIWNTEVVENSEFPAVRFTYHSPDMEMGFPGNVDAEVLYTWNDNNEIIMDYQCVSNKKTVVNVTNHAYFNLHGQGNGDILDHFMTLKGSSFTPVDSLLIPTGEIRPVNGTPFDFTSPVAIGERINDPYDQLVLGKGYDHNFVLDNKDDVDVKVYDEISGRVLELITDQPGLQFYTGNFLDGSQKGYGGVVYDLRTGFCLEPGHFPDSPNHPDFPSTILDPGEIFKTRTIYRFTVF
jgi:aldose 1-epimerase